ncbi:hypothetical protein LTR17_008464 [Elasticomyces elasticus]|nr:hypothetical protein LTR17_008464 [Elasticomyces elasticus]
MATPDMVEIDPDGDVFLECGGEATSNKFCKLRVSSAVLRLGSTVFKSLLGPNFKEGNTLAECATVVIPLPEDDPKDMQTLCQILHLRYDQISDTPSANEIHTLAILCDKYGCARAVRPCVELWVLNGLPLASLQDQAAWMNAALLLRYLDLGRRLGAKLIREACTSIMELVKPEESKSKILCAELDTIRSKFLKDLNHLIEDELDNVLFSQKNSKCNHNCPVDPLWVSSFAQQLRDQFLWPTFKRTGSLDEQLSRAEAFVAEEIPGEVKHVHERCRKVAESRVLGLRDYSKGVIRRAKEVRQALDSIDLRHLDG